MIEAVEFGNDPVQTAFPVGVLPDLPSTVPSFGWPVAVAVSLIAGTVKDS